MVGDYKFGRSLGMLSMQISRGIGKHLQQSLRKNGYELLPTEWSVISFLMTYADRTQQDIANFLWINKVMVKRMLDKLETEGLLVRQTLCNDKRFNVVNLTDKGKAFYRDAVKCANEALSKAYEGFTDEEEQMLIDLLARVKHNLTD